MRRMWNVSGLKKWCGDVFLFIPQKKIPCFSTSRICTMLHPLIIVPLSTCLTARGLNRGSAGNYSTPPHPPACGVSTIILLLQSRLEPMWNRSVNIKHWLLDGQSRFIFFSLLLTSERLQQTWSRRINEEFWQWREKIKVQLGMDYSQRSRRYLCLLICTNCIWDVVPIITACLLSFNCVRNLHRSDGHVK